MSEYGSDPWDGSDVEALFAELATQGVDVSIMVFPEQRARV